MTIRRKSIEQGQACQQECRPIQLIPPGHDGTSPEKAMEETEAPHNKEATDLPKRPFTHCQWQKAIGPKESTNGGQQSSHCAHIEDFNDAIAHSACRAHV